MKVGSIVQPKHNYKTYLNIINNISGLYNCTPFYPDENSTCTVTQIVETPFKYMGIYLAEVKLFENGKEIPFNQNHWKEILPPASEEELLAINECINLEPV